MLVVTKSVTHLKTKADKNNFTAETSDVVCVGLSQNQKGEVRLLRKYRLPVLK